MLRFTIRFVLGSLLGLVLLVLTYPVWLPWVISGVGPRLGLTVSSHDREGYGRLVLKEVRLVRDGLDLSAGRVSLPIWPFWVIQTERAEDTGSLVRIDQWHIEITPDPAAEPAAEVSVADLHRQFASLVPDLQRLLPSIHAENGTLATGGRVIVFDEVRWREPSLDVVMGLPDGRWSSRVALILRRDGVWMIDLTTESWDASLSAVISGPSERLEVDLGLQWKTSAFSGRVVFGPTGTLPESARLQSEILSLDPLLLGVGGYGPITGGLEFSWDHDRYAASADLSAQPLDESNPDLPGLTAALMVEGDLEGARFERLDLDVPWARARLSEPIDLQFGPGFRDQSADLGFEIDLDASPLPATGQVSGQVRVTSTEGRVPSLHASFSAADLGVDRFSGLQAEAEVSLDYPLLGVDRLTVRLDPETGGSFEGEADLAAKTLSGEILVWASGEFLGEHLPVDVPGGKFVLAGSVIGPWSAPEYSVRAVAEQVNLPGLLPASIDGRFHGCGLDLDHARVSLHTDDAELQLVGGLFLAGSDQRAVLTGIELSHRGETVLAATPGSVLETDLVSRVGGDLRLEGEDGFLAFRGEVDWPGSAEWRIEAENLNSGLLEGLIERGIDGLDIATLQSMGSWNGGPARFTASATGRILSGEEPVGFRLRLSGDDEWLTVDELVVASTGTDVIHASGRLPGALTPEGEMGIEIDWDRSIELRAETLPNPLFWDRIGVLAGFDLTEPRLRLELNGPVAAPTGSLAFSAAALNLRRNETQAALPPINGISLSAELTADRAILENSRILIEGEEVSLEGELPLSRDDWLRLALEREWPDWNQATVRLRAEDVRLAVFSSYLPQILAPAGFVDLDLTLRPDRQLNGFLVLEDAALRPIRPFGALQEIEARVEFSGRSIRCNEVVAVIGGQKVTLTGEFDWEESGDIAYEFALKGIKVPLFREPGLVIRSDLDLRLRGSGTEVALLSGNLKLSDSLFVADLNMFLSGSVDSPSRRPPYFSVEAEPFGQWRLDLQVDGPEFLRVETPVFKGLLSAGFSLTGTLREPKALGEFRIERGSVEFPFATLKMSSGTLSIRDDNPYDVRLDLEAGSRVFGYDIAMRVDGYASAPRLTFESEPSLGSDAVLLMLTTGEIPSRSGYYSLEQRLTKLAVYLGRNLLVEFGLGGGNEERFVIESGGDISLKGRETFEVEVVLDEKWSLVGGYDEFDAYNGGIKWRVYAK